MFAIEPGSSGHGNEELAAIGAWTCIRHREDAGLAVMQIGTEFVTKLIAWTTGAFAERVVVAAGQIDHMDMLDFTAALQQLPDDQREALLLVGAEGFSYEEAAEMCGCAVGTIKSRVSRARRRLAEMLGHDIETAAVS